MKLIDKSTLVAEIERLDELNIFLIPTDKYNEDYKCGYEHALEKVRDFLDTLEMKEVDLEMELNSYLEMVKATDEDIDFDNFAKHFFELGLKTQKGE